MVLEFGVFNAGNDWWWAIDNLRVESTTTALALKLNVNSATGDVILENPPYHLDGWFKELSPETRTAIWRNGVKTIGEVNQQDWKALGLEFLDEPELGDTPLQQQLTYYANFLTWTEGR